MALKTIDLTEGWHYHLFEHDHGWAWNGIGLFNEYCCDRPFATQAAARNDAEKSLLGLLSTQPAPPQPNEMDAYLQEQYGWQGVSE